jgi:DNA mismatch repair ATPase MutL
MCADLNLDPNKVSSKGHFIAVDGRPIGTTLGLSKDFIKLYKTNFRHRLSLRGTTELSVDPFLCLQLQCPARSYDVNVEPSKDEVLFTNPHIVLQLVEDFLDSVYGSLPARSGAQNSGVKKDVSKMGPDAPFNLLLAKTNRPSFSDAVKPVRTSQDEVACTPVGNGPRTKVVSPCSVPLEDEVKEPNHDISSSSAVGTKSHRNMFDFGEDDVDANEPPTLSQQGSQTEADSAELRRASVTNPWSIAKLHAPASSTKRFIQQTVDTGFRNQPMTPDPDAPPADLVSRTHRRPVVELNNLPTPAASSSPRSPVYQNPGPPLRRRVQANRAEENDEIQFTQETETERQGERHTSMLESWMESGDDKTQRRLPPLPLASVHDGDHIKSQPNSLQQSNASNRPESPSSQIIAPANDSTRANYQPNSLRKPFVPPFRTPKKSSVLHPPQRLTPTVSSPPELDSLVSPTFCSTQSQDRSGSPIHQSHPKPLSQSHQHPLASPPLLQPSPPQLPKSLRNTPQLTHPELDEIMDFEYRKKAANAQRNKQTKLSNRYLNPGQLADIQRESSVSSAFSPPSVSPRDPMRKGPPPSVSVREEEEDPSYNPARLFEQRFSDTSPISSQPSSQTPLPKQSPHHNRYQAAKAALGRSRAQTSLSQGQPPASEELAAASTNMDQTTSQLPASDPRAYLIHHRKANGASGSPARRLSSGGLKIKRTKTSKLPLESVPPDSAVHNTSAKLTSQFPSLEALRALFNNTSKIDAYPKTGANSFVLWEANSRDLPTWETKISELVRERYIARIGGGEEVPAQVQVRLGVAFRAHDEQFA